MKRKIISSLFSSAVLSLSVFGFFGVSVTVQASPITLLAASCNPGAGGLAATVFTPWYKYLPGEDVNGKCRAQAATIGGNGADKDDVNIGKTVSLVLIAVIELLTHVAGLVAVGFMIWGSILYVTSQGEPTGLNNAKSTLVNAVIGFVIVILAIGVVQFVGNAVR